MWRWTLSALGASALLFGVAAAERSPWLMQQVTQLRPAVVSAIPGFGPAPVPAQPFASVKSPTWSSTDAYIDKLQTFLKGEATGPRAASAYAQLGGLYLQKVRETGDPTYYGKAEAVLQASLRQQPDNNVTALVGMGTLQLARHQFAGALATGEQARALAPSSYVVYGVLGDALIELGRYDEAIDAFQNMIDRRPDLSSYSRVSYARELHGDLPGAIQAMSLAADAGAPRTESTAWTRVQLGNLYFSTGDLDQAEQQYQAALRMLPNYVHGLGGMARVAAARGDLNSAARLYQQALDAVPLPEYAIGLGDVYRALGDEPNARRQDALVRVITQLQRANGVDVDVELALFEADHTADAAALSSAVERERAEYARRPSVHVADALAWTLYRAGRPAEALPYAQEALELGSKDPLLLFHTGAIAAAADQPDQARTWLTAALAQNPQFSVRYAPEARRLLVALKGAQ